MGTISNLYKYSAATQGFVLWGSWAFYINSQVSTLAGIKAGIVQGLFSFVSTLLVISILSKLYNHFKQPLLKLTLPTLLIVLTLSSILITAHTIANTPEIIKTVTPSLIVAILFCSFTTYKLTKQIP